MKTVILRTALLALIAFVAPMSANLSMPSSAQALDAGELIDYFVRELGPYGRWTTSSQYGRMWEPYAQTNANWRPYSEGRWVYSDEWGWVWDPDEEWGNVAYHYGRWTNDRGRWYWVPDRKWGPAWVDWRMDDDYIGWAPLPPEADYYWEDDAPQYSYHQTYPAAYVFVPHRHFAQRDVVRYVVLPDRNREILRRGRNMTMYRTVQGRIRNEGPRRDVVERIGGHRIESVRYQPRAIGGRDLPERPERDARRVQDDRVKENRVQRDCDDRPVRTRLPENPVLRERDDRPIQTRKREEPDRRINEQHRKENARRGEPDRPVVAKKRSEEPRKNEREVVARQNGQGKNKNRVEEQQPQRKGQKAARKDDRMHLQADASVGETHGKRGQQQARVIGDDKQHGKGKGRGVNKKEQKEKIES